MADDEDHLLALCQHSLLIHPLHIQLCVADALGKVLNEISHIARQSRNCRELAEKAPGRTATGISAKKR